MHLRETRLLVTWVIHWLRARIGNAMKAHDPVEDSFSAAGFWWTYAIIMAAPLLLLAVGTQAWLEMF